MPETATAATQNGLFEYIRRHHPDIRTVWMCYHKDVRNYVKRLGYEACLLIPPPAKLL